MEIDTYYMHEEMVYELKLVVFKDTRRAEFTQILYVATGSPPRMEIRLVCNQSIFVACPSGLVHRTQAGIVRNSVWVRVSVRTLVPMVKELNLNKV